MHHLVPRVFIWASREQHSALTKSFQELVSSDASLFSPNQQTTKLISPRRFQSRICGLGDTHYVEVDFRRHSCNHLLTWRCHDYFELYVGLAYRVYPYLLRHVHDNTRTRNMYTCTRHENISCTCFPNMNTNLLIPGIHDKTR